ncbi:MAG: hypothetical protein IKO40_13820 [Kiritimatiellae bacterium]|jgi:hypothetical protein|nr:hypothetical protein [Kiritimatiellia bacterium]
MALQLGIYLVIWALVVFVLFVAPIWLLVAGVRSLRAKRGGRIRIAISAMGLLFSAFAIDSFCPWPWHVKILDQGTAPDGRSYVLLQTNGGEPCEIRLYIRSEGVGWVFHYVDHEVFPWRFGGHVEFSPDTATAQIFRGSKEFNTIDVRPSEEPGQSEVLPPSETAEDVLRRFL